MDTPRLGHVQIDVSDFRRAAAWYESILRFSATSYLPHLGIPSMGTSAGGVQFAMSELEPVPAAKRYNFSVVDVDSWWAKLGERATANMR